MPTILSDAVVDAFVSVVTLYFIFALYARWRKHQLLYAAAAAAAEEPAPLEAAPAPATSQTPVLAAAAVVLVVVLAVFMTPVPLGGSGGRGGAGAGSGDDMAALDARRPLHVWQQATLRVSATGPGQQLVRYQWLQLSAGEGGRVPVLDCADWSPATTRALQNATLAPLPPLSREALDDAQRHRDERAAREQAQEARDKALRRCIVSEASTLPVNASDHLLQRARLSSWLPASAVDDVAAGNYSLRHVAVLRNGSRFYPGALGVRPAAAGKYTTGPVALSEQGLLAAANDWITRQQEHSAYGLKQSALDRCLCLPYFGLFGTGAHLAYDLGRSQWHLWLGAELVRVVTAGCGGQGCVANQTYAQTKASAWPDNLVRPLQELGPYTQGGVADVFHYASIVVAYVDLAATLDPLIDLHVNLLEPGWQDSDLPPAAVSPVAAVFDIEQLVGGAAGVRETPPLEHRDTLCFAHCMTLEAALTAAT